MSLVRCLSSFLLLFIGCFAPLRLFGDTMVVVTVRTDSPGGSSCLFGSSGPQVQCVSGSLTSPPLAEATGSASAGVGALSLSVTAGTTGGGLAVAGGTVSYDYQLLFPAGTPSETIVGKYAVYASAAGDYGQFGNISLSQGSSTVSIPIEAPATAIPTPVVISSAYVAGQPFVISGTMQAEASSPGEGEATASVELTGFFDAAGNAISFTTAPEPAYWPVLGVCLAVMWGRKRII